MASSSSKKRKIEAQPQKSQPATSGSALQWVIIGVLMVAAFFGAYKFMSGSRGNAPATTNAGQAPSSTQQAGTTATGPEVIGTAQLADGVQRIAIDVSTGVYNPNVIELKAGVPAELTFGQSQGCTGVVHSSELGFSEDLTGGPKTVKLKALPAGTYQFSCGMDMVFGKVVVR
jgi:plastocyanin